MLISQKYYMQIINLLESYLKKENMRSGFLIITIICFSLLSFKSNAQKSQFILHKVKYGETLSMLARQYNTTVGDIMRLNSWNANSKLVLEESIKIPDTDSSGGIKSADTAKAFSVIIVEKPFAPIKYTVEAGDNLYRISKRFNVSMEQLKILNHLESESLHVGQVLDIGLVPSNAPSGDKSTESIQENTSTAVKQENKKMIHEPVKEIVVETIQKDYSEDLIENEILPEEKTIEAETIITEESITVKKTSTSGGFFADYFGKDGSGKKLKKTEGTGMIFKNGQWME